MWVASTELGPTACNCIQSYTLYESNQDIIGAPKYTNEQMLHESAFSVTYDFNATHGYGWVMLLSTTNVQMMEPLIPRPTISDRGS